MTKLTITREQLLEIIETDHVQCGEASYLARMALAAMDSESGCLPLDYLQGHKDGLEWASQLAEANHPETGDWLYDDPIELAKAIRKGPDMPPAQPVADSEPVIVVGDDGGDALSYRRLIQSFEPGTKLYLHAQPAQVVNGEYGDAYQGAREDLAIWKRRALEAEESVRRLEQINDHLVKEAQGESRIGEPVIAQPVPVVPDELLNEIDDLLSVCRVYACRSRRSGSEHDIPRTEKAQEWLRACRSAMLATSTQSPGSDPAIVPGKWIPVSERMPEDAQWCVVITEYGYYVQCWSDGQGWLGDDISIPNVDVTHWMPLPSAPQEVKGE